MWPFSPKLSIEYPKMGDGVRALTIVYGNGNSGKLGVRLFVFSPDGRWYIQPRPVWHTQWRWSCKCFIGNAKSEPGHTFQIVAADSSLGIAQGALYEPEARLLRNPPKSLKVSNIVNVYLMYD